MYKRLKEVAIEEDIADDEKKCIFEDNARQLLRLPI
jgi:hypothetical protein